jgi:hypothetical protein
MLIQKNIFEQLSEGCDKDCRFDVGVSSVTAAYYPPVYDKNGVNVNPNGNTSRTQYHCMTCGKYWVTQTRLGETTIKILNENEEV